MSYQTDTIVWGETYGINVTPKDSEGEPVVLDETWQVAVQFRKQDGTGPIFYQPEIAIADGVASCSINTGNSPWGVGIYYYDVRITDPDGFDFWSETIALKLIGRQTDPSS